MSKIIKWPITFTHSFHHKRMADNLFECLHEFIDFAKNSNVDFPTNSDGSINFERISVDYLIQWFYVNATKPTHIHEGKEDDKEDNVRSGRDLSDGRSNRDDEPEDDPRGKVD